MEFTFEVLGGLLELSAYTLPEDEAYLEEVMDGKEG